MVPKELPVGESDDVSSGSLSLHLPCDLSAMMFLRRVVDFLFV